MTVFTAMESQNEIPAYLKYFTYLNVKMYSRILLLHHDRTLVGRYHWGGAFLNLTLLKVCDIGLT